MISFLLVFNVCVPLLTGNGDSCEAYVIDAFPVRTECTDVMHANPLRRDDAFLSCDLGDVSLLQDRRDGRNVAQIIADLEKSL